MFHGLFYNREPYKTMNHRCKKRFLKFFLFCSRFLPFLTCFYFPNVFFISKKRYQSSQRQADQQEALSQ